MTLEPYAAPADMPWDPEGVIAIGVCTDKLNVDRFIGIQFEDSKVHPFDDDEIDVIIEQLRETQSKVREWRANREKDPNGTV